MCPGQYVVDALLDSEIFLSTLQFGFLRDMEGRRKAWSARGSD